MLQKAIVTEITDKTVTARVKRTCACAGSESCSKSCFAGSETYIDVNLKKIQGIEKGDIIEIESSTNTVLAFAFLLFTAPLIIAIISFFVTQALTDSVYLPYIVTGLVFLILFAVSGKLLNRYAASREMYRIKRRLI